MFALLPANVICKYAEWSAISTKSAIVPVFTFTLETKISLVVAATPEPAANLVSPLFPVFAVPSSNVSAKSIV